MKLYVLPSLIVFSAIAFALVQQHLENNYLVRIIDLRKSYVQEFTIINILNSGTTKYNDYILTIPPSQAKNVAKIIVNEPNDETQLKITQTVVDNFGTHYFVALPKPLYPGEQIRLQLVYYFLNNIKPLPEYIKFGDSQYFIYEGSKTFYSIYPTNSQVTQVKMMGKFEDLDVKKDGFLSKNIDNGIQYDFDELIGPFDVKKLSIRYEYPLPISCVDSLKQEFWFSHISNSISIKQSYNLTNAGAKLEGSFSRSDLFGIYRAGSDAAIPIFRLELPLPVRSKNIYYNDLIGNVSTSNYKYDDQQLLLELKPRYPLFGGWNYNFTVGWIISLSSLLRTNSDKNYIIKLPLLYGPRDISSYGTIESNYIFPEGTKNIQIISSEDPVNKLTFKTYSYLDNQGRPTVKLIYKNFLEWHQTCTVLIKYSYSQNLIFAKLLFIGSIIAFIFLIAFLLSQFDFTTHVKPKTI